MGWSIIIASGEANCIMNVLLGTFYLEAKAQAFGEARDFSGTNGTGWVFNSLSLCSD